MVEELGEQLDEGSVNEDTDWGDNEEDDKKKKKRKQRRPQRRRVQKKKPEKGKQVGQAGQQPSPDKDLALQQKGVKPAEEKLPKKAPTTLGQAITRPIQDAAQAQLTALENKSPAVKKAADAVRSTSRAIRTAKEFPKKLVQKAVSKATAPIRKAASEAGKKVVEAIAKQPAGRVAIQGIQATTRSVQAINRVLQAMRLSNLMAQLYAKMIKPLVDLAIKALAGVSVIAWVVIAIVIIIAGFFYYMYTGGLNKINSLAGGSIFVDADYSQREDRDLVVDLQQKSAGMVPGHVLKLYSPSGLIVGLTQYDIDWQWDVEAQRWTHPLDIRVLETLKYLTDKHEYVEIGLLKTNAPTLLRESLRVKRVGQEYETITKESYSAFYLGQGMAITAVDYSKIENLPPKTPVEMNWQKTITEKIARPIWEELNFTAGYLDNNADVYKESAVLEFGDPAMQDTVGTYKSALGDIEYMDLYEQTFAKIDRILELLGRIDTYPEFQGNALDDRTKNYFDAVKNRFDSLQFSVGYLNSDSSDAGLEGRIRRMGSTENIKRLSDGIQYIYKATQVANMVDWNEKGIANLKWNQAYEARNKIRQVIKELLEMPRETATSNSNNQGGANTTNNFNYDLVVKQIITYSPEDDLDNGRMNIDVFPKGITAVDVGGVAIEGTSTETTTDANGNVISGVTIGDGVVDLADAHFSYMPIDNGSFSKHGTNYIWVYDPRNDGDESAWAVWASNISQGVLRLLKVTAGLGVMTAAKALHDYWTGGCVSDPVYETCQPVTYKGFLQVAF